MPASQVEDVLDVDRLLWMLAFDILTVICSDTSTRRQSQTCRKTGTESHGCIDYNRVAI